MGHAYTLVYETIPGVMRDQPIDSLEIGLAMGGPEVEGGAISKETSRARPP